MTPLTLSLAVISLLGLCIASTTLVLLLAWRRDPPNVSALRSDLDALHGAHTDLADRVHHWFRRESTRKARDKKREKQEAEDRETPEAVRAAPGDHKALLRARLAAARMGTGAG